MGNVRGVTLRPRFARAALAIGTAFTLAFGAQVALAPHAAADESDEAIVFADDQLTACINKGIGSGRAPDETITEADLKKFFSLNCNDSFAVKSLEGIEQASEIRNVTFIGADHTFRSADSLKPLSGLTKMTSLMLTRTDLTNEAFAGLELPKALSTFKVTYSPELSDITAMKEMTGLRTVDISFNSPQLTDLSPLSGLTKITSLSAAALSDLEDLEPLATLESLQYLNVQKSKVSDLSPLAELTSISTLTASSTLVEDLRPLAGLINMKNLDLDYAKLKSLEGVEAMHKMTDLHIMNNIDIAGNLDPIRDNPTLSRIHMNATGVTSIDALSNLPSLKNIQALSNHVTSLVGLPAAPEAVSVGTFAITAQNIQYNNKPQYVPNGAKRFMYDTTGDLELREQGQFPDFGGNLEPLETDNMPIVTIEVRKAWPELEYSFSQNPKGNDRFAGTVKMPIVWSSITSEDSATVSLGEHFEQQIETTAGFPAATYIIKPMDDDAAMPEWITLDESTGVLTIEPDGQDAVDYWPFTVQVADALGNTITDRFDLTVPEPGNTVFEIGEDQQVNAGEDLVFTVTRADADNNPYTGKASVDYRTVDGSAMSGVHYTDTAGTLTWDAGDTRDKTVTVPTLTDENAAGSPDVAMTLELSDPQPESFSELGGGFSSDGFMSFPTPELSSFTIDEAYDVEASTVDKQTVTLTVSRNKAAKNHWNGDASVHVMTQDGFAQAGTHYEPLHTLLEWGPGDFDDKEIEITILPGAAGTPELDFGVELVDPSTHMELGVPETTLMTISYPVPEPSVLSLGEDQTVEAGAETVSFTVSRTEAERNPWLGEASVRFTTHDGTAKAGEHYEAFDNVLTWAAGETDDIIVEVPLKAGAAGDPERNFSVELTDPSEYTIVGARATASAAIPYPVPYPTTLNIAGEPTVKAGEPLVFTVTPEQLSEPAWAGELSVRVLTSDHEAEAGTHYEAVDEVVTWKPGERDPIEVTVKTMPGFKGSDPRTFSIELADPSEYAELGESVNSVGTIAYEPDDSTPPNPGDGDEDGDGDGDGDDGDTDGEDSDIDGDADGDGGDTDGDIDGDGGDTDGDTDAEDGDVDGEDGDNDGQDGDADGADDNDNGTDDGDNDNGNDDGNNTDDDNTDGGNTDTNSDDGADDNDDATDGGATDGGSSDDGSTGGDSAGGGSGSALVDEGKNVEAQVLATTGSRWAFGAAIGGAAALALLAGATLLVAWNRRGLRD
ncbi:Calx-beta domain-containing protein [Leucobacter chinensis]|uniref:Calx-beta domain-containing protein n=1 Tax=Leucobacter chinensis TaxID=2851010 RepID=UPI001C2511B0|nr:Calx-beta domain-containing protein [Leucobacter chinensis]